MRTSVGFHRWGVAALALTIGSVLAVAASASNPDLQHVDVTPSAVPQEVELVRHDYGPGETSGWHIHHGVELAYVMTGDLQVSIAGKQPIIVHAGDSFQVPRDTPHEARNIGSGEASVIISFLMDKGVPWKISVPPPGAR